ncbi:MAG: hypothetical protein V5A21_03110 [Halapricum sp.]
METPSQAVLVVVVAALFVTPAAALSLPGQTAQQTATNESVQPGAQFAGVVSVGQAEVDGAVEGRAFGQAIAAADSNESKAAVVAERMPGLENRLQNLEQQREQLRIAYENDSLDQSTYEAKTTALAARIQQVERQLNRSHTVAVALPEQARDRAGVNVSAIEQLRSQAGEMRGGEMAEIARGIAGPDVGMGMPDTPRGGPPAGVPGNWTTGPGSGGPPADPGPSDDHGPSTDHGPNERDNRTSNR